MHFSRTSDLIFFNSGALPNILHYITKVCAKNDVYIFVLRDSWPLYLKIIKFELYTAFQLKICNRQRGRQMSQKWAVFACEMHSTICVTMGFVQNRLAIPRVILVFFWCKSIHFWGRYARKTTFTFSFSLTLTFDLWPYICCPCYGSRILSKSKARGSGGLTERITDMVQHLMRPSGEARIIMRDFFAICNVWSISRFLACNRFHFDASAWHSEPLLPQVMKFFVCMPHRYVTFSRRLH